MDETSLRLLGMERIRAALAERCATTSGRRASQGLAPLPGWPEARAEAAAVEALARWRASGADLALPDDEGVEAAAAA
ncbi:MAG: hypothetical protein D6739_07975, partial [Nitrospirae bacterium]